MFYRCKAHQIDAKGGKSEIEKHSKTNKHRKSVKYVRSQVKIDKLLTATSTSHADKVKNSELIMTAFITVHNIPFINNFSILVDEASAGIEHLCVVVRTVGRDFKVLEDFFSLTELVSATADVLFDVVQKSFQEGGIELQDNLLGMAGDGVNVIMGANNSLSSCLKEVVHGLFIMKYICHSFHVCASKASQKLPNFIEQLTLTSVAVLKEYQHYMNSKIHKILHPAQTRWLSFPPVVKRMLKQYQSLILFYQDGSLSEGFPAAQYILTTLRDPTYKFYLQFLSFCSAILRRFEQRNAE
ncbi:hypothetical protein PR048_019313 [Dryococelus australis]|uniref:DUF4371 domain-containing protein n=1 Tax=Dryococelus australis TaxID=614101 RepID=A0ABQ9H3A6_9NEOP|nr:hypothetical protein PR048_019313 [Dryococelus australis]